jgi:serine/threonine protein kinase/Tfp pilus assembly protein PilF
VSSPTSAGQSSNDCPTSRIVPPPDTRSVASAEGDAPTANFNKRPRLTSQVVVPPPRDTAVPPDGPLDTAPQPKVAAEAAKVAEAFLAMPRPGETAYGFQIVREIGSGGFGRVFLATQATLAGRFVVLKVSADLAGESRALAKLQHTNIVPVYSVHKAGPLQAVCMPYFGTTTLQNILRKYRESDAVPPTGKAFVETFRYLNAARQTVCDEGPPEPPPDPATDAVFSLLAAGSYVRAVVWLAVRLTDGMAHAHDRGIIHRDIKPANILLTDDGQPMLLDFGVSEEIVRRAAVPSPTLGGTLAYMAPEHLREVLTGVPAADARSDIYALGIVLYELLTGRYPFRMPDESGLDEVERLIAERRTGLAHAMRDCNRDVSPGLESIVRKCLAFDPAARYQSAADLRDDLTRYLNDQPLKFAPERSLRERAQKWSRRHPFLTSSTVLGGVLAVLLLVAGAGFWANSARLARLEAEQTFRAFRDEASAARQLLYANPDAPGVLDNGLRQGYAALSRYDPAAFDWDRRPTVAHLTADERAELRRELVDLYLMLARGLWLRAGAATPPDAGKYETALSYNLRAGDLAGDDAPRMLYVQRQSMYKELGRAAEAAAAGKAAEPIPPKSARDFYFAAAVEQDAERFPQAIKFYQQAQAMDPKAVWAYFGEGVCRIKQKEWVAARGCFTSVLALDPTSAFAQFNRGLACLRMGDPEAAVKDFDAVVAAKPDFADAYLFRGEAQFALKEFAAALADVDAAVGRGADLTIALPLRAKLRRVTGDLVGADADTFAPTNADGWIHRGLDKLATDKAGALAAFEKAVAVDPKSAKARVYQAHVLGQTGREADCVAALTAALELDPRNFSALAARGVMRGRLKEYKLALADARAALDMSFAPLTVYQVACVYAHASKEDAAYRAEAITLLGIALRGGFGHAHLAGDRDLEPIRRTPEFEALAAKARRDRPAAKD